MTAIKLKTEETDAKTIRSQVTAAFNAVVLPILKLMCPEVEETGNVAVLALSEKGRYKYTRIITLWCRSLYGMISTKQM